MSTMESGCGTKTITNKLKLVLPDFVFISCWRTVLEIEFGYY
jgi:hypothetical protein